MRILFLLVLASLSGCSWMFGDTFRDRTNDYLKAEEAPSTQLPTDMAPLVEDRFAIPDAPQSETLASGEEPKKFKVPKPDPMPDEAAMDDESATLSQYRDDSLNPRLERDGAGSQILRLDSGFANAWSKVADALTETSFKLSDLNRSVGTYYLELPAPVAEDAEKKSWWGRLWGSDEPEFVTYQLKMNRARLGVYLSLLLDTETLADDALTKEVLTEIKTQLTK